MKTYRVVLWALALVGLAADQATKYGIFSWLDGAQQDRFWLLKFDDAHGFALAPNPNLNRGALFGLGQEEGFANNAFAFVSLLAAVAIVYWSFRRSAARDLWVCVALGLILAGTLGNLYDRVVFHGVRDFLHWNFLFNWPVFNIADSCLVCGAGLLLLQAFGHQAAGKALPADKTPGSCMGATPTAKG
ncbi:MAG TPA: signal peptidase II [Gemmataceae bacterium]|nr:signal peptidase II [Gemmataceae bacterium]